MKNNTTNLKYDDIPVLGIGTLGYGVMAKAHTNGYKQMPYVFWPPPAIPRLVKICGRNEEKLKIEAEMFGYESYCTDWQDLISDRDIDILVNVGSNDIHAEPCIEAAKAGKHIVCEKPLARDAREAKAMLDAVVKAKVKHLCNFSNRMIPAMALAKKLLMEEDFGRIYHFRVNYLMDYYTDPNIPRTWRMIKELAGSGITADLTVHAVDLARWLCGEPKSVSAITQTYFDQRPLAEGSDKKGKIEVDDASIAILEFSNGAIGYLESTAFATGRRTYIGVELNAEKGSFYWNFEDLNHLHVYYTKEKRNDTRGYHKIDVSQEYHPYFDKWLPYGEKIGYSAAFVHSAYHIAKAVINDEKLEPMIATFEDGYKANVICDAIIESAEKGRKIDIRY